MKKKFKSKWFRVAVEGATTDGRTIERSWISDMAEQYAVNTYGARINCEHIKSAMPGSEFGAYGDVLALKAEEVEIAGVKKLALFASIEPNAALLALNKAGQKIYTSVEVQPKFSDTGKAYLVGLAVTDSPASLGTEALSFSAAHGNLSARKTHPDNLFTAAEEATLEFEEVVDPVSAFAALKSKVAELLSKGKDQAGKDAADFAALGEALDGLLTHAAAQQAEADKTSAALAALRSEFTAAVAEFAALKIELAKAPASGQVPRPAATGTTNTAMTEF